MEDHLIEDPLQCDFDINTLACKTSVTENAPCLTDAQLSAVKSIYAGPVNARTGAQIYPGFSTGSEIEWLLQEGDLANAFSIPILQNLVYDNLSYNSSTFDWASDVSDVDTQAGSRIDAINPDLSDFREAGGKILVYQGWADPFNAATWPIEHLQQIEEATGGNVNEWFELFMVPGGGHCGAASYYPHVPATYHTVGKMVEWVEKGQRPREVLSTEPEDGSGRSRLLCPWPEKARFMGGDEDEARSYTCGN